MNNWVIENLGWTLLHSLWQISLISVVLWTVLRILRNSAAHFRYSILVLGLIFSFVLPILTFVYLSIEIKPTIKHESQITKNIQTEKPFQATEIGLLENKQGEETSVIAPNITSSPSQKYNFLPILVSVWILGVILLSIRFVGGMWKVYQYKNKNVSPVSTDWQEKFDELSKFLQIKKTVRFLQSQTVEMPVVIGWLKPVVLFPTSVFLQISPKELETILIHELAHIKRNDYLVNIIQTLAEITLFYHPCIWWVSAKIRTEREFSVDEFVVEIFQREKLIYAKALANLEELRLSSAQSTSFALAANGGNLMNRISKILQNHHKPTFSNLSIWSGVFAVTFVLGIIGGFYWLKTSEVKKPQNKRKVAVVISSYMPDANYRQSTQNILDLQKKYEIPATWVLDSGLIKQLEESGNTEDFFRQGYEERSEFILSVPNINYTIFINGDDEYTALWQKRIESINAVLSKNGNNLKYWTTTSNQIPQQIEDYINKSKLKQIKLPMLFDFRFHTEYEKNCNFSAKKMTCQDTTAEKQKEIRENYLKYINEIFELNESYSQEKFGIEIPQVLYLTASKLTYDSANDLLQMLVDKGYEFVPFEEVKSNETRKQLENPKYYEFAQKKMHLLDKYLPFKLIDPERRRELEKLVEELKNNKKEVKIEITTKDMKIKEN